METYQASANANAPTTSPELPARLTIGIGRPGNEILIEADPLTDGVRMVAYGGVDLEFDGDDFDLIAELLQRALGN